MSAPFKICFYKAQVFLKVWYSTQARFTGIPSKQITTLLKPQTNYQIDLIFINRHTETIDKIFAF